MKLTILGSGSALPVTNRNPSGYLLDIGEETILLDSGAGTSRQIVRAGRSIDEIDKIFFSHFHIDHIGDLPSLLFALKNENFEVKNLDIYAHPDFAHFLETYQELYGDWIMDENPFYQFNPLEKGTYNFHNFDLRIYPARHRPESYIYCFEAEDKTLVYTGDTEYCVGLIKAAENADLLLTECSFPDSHPVEAHLSPKKIQRVIKHSTPKKIVLTHLYPENDRADLVDEIKLGTETEVTRAEDLQTFVI